MASPTPPLRPGDQLASTVCGTRVVVVRAPAQGRPLIACGGSPMTPAASAPPAAPGGSAAVTLIGKRYVDASETVELLCTSSGAGALYCDGVEMTLRSAKPLPASDLPLFFWGVGTNPPDPSPVQPPAVESGSPARLQKTAGAPRGSR